MKFVAIVLLSLISFSVLATDNVLCARRYIEGSLNLIDIAESFNHGSLGKFEYALAVADVDATILATRVRCGDENSEALKCVNDTKPGYTKIRNKMFVSGVLQGDVSHIDVSILEVRRMLKGSIRGALRELFNGSENVCTIDE